LAVPHGGTNVVLVMKARDAEHPLFTTRPWLQHRKYERPGLLGIDAAGQVWWYSSNRNAAVPFGF
jgi:hypothetical protein